MSSMTSFSIDWKNDVTSLISKFKNYSSSLIWNLGLHRLENLGPEDGNDQFETTASTTPAQDELYALTIEYESTEKRIFTFASSPEEASRKFHRHIVCQWVGYPWETPEDLLCGTIDKLVNGAKI
jgi:hypothetical protein